MIYDQRKVEELIAKLESGVRDADIKKIRNEVFDARTLRTIYRFMERGVFDVMDRIISTGKEANVFRARKGSEFLAVKIYRVETTDFRHMWRYLYGDPRFLHVKRNRWGIIRAWVRREFKNLDSAFRAGVSVPAPFAYRDNVIVMEFVGENGSPAPLLKNCLPDDTKLFADALLDSLAALYFRARLVHADLSEYNILVRRNTPVLIDFGQAVPWDHPLSYDFFQRDMERLRKVLSMLGIDVYDPVSILKERARR